jgi:hypothetical protein
MRISMYELKEICKRNATIQFTHSETIIILCILVVKVVHQRPCEKNVPYILWTEGVVICFTLYIDGYKTYPKTYVR